MLTSRQIEELGWAETPSGTFLFESTNDKYRCWVMHNLGGKYHIYGMPSNQPEVGEDEPGEPKYYDDIEDQMELYDIMVTVGILPKEE